MEEVLNDAFKMWDETSGLFYWTATFITVRRVARDGGANDNLLMI